MTGAVALAVVAGCAPGPVEVRRSAVPADQRAACTELVAGLPRSVSDVERRETEGDPWSAAWGDPAIVLRCGVAPPADFTRFSSCQVVNDVDWYVPESAIDDQQADVVMTTIGRVPGVEVRLPATYRPPADAMVDLAAAVAAYTSVTERCG